MKIPVSELFRRRSALQEKMAMQQIDGALIALNTTMYYFSGTMQCQYVYVPSQGECLGIVRKNMARAKEETELILVQMAGIGDIPGLIAGAGYAQPARLGLELDILPAAIYLRLASLFNPAVIADISTQVREVRQAKSQFELDLLKQAALQADIMNRSVPALLVEGKEELVLASELEAILRRHGHQGVSRMRGFNQEIFFGHVLSGEAGAITSFLDSPTGGFGVSPAQPQGAGNKKIRAGEPVIVDYGGIYQGYVIDQTRLYSIGRLPDLLNKAFDVSLEIQQKVAGILFPGTSGQDIYAAAAATASAAGLGEYFMGAGDNQVKFVGHGVGLEFNEFPILAKGSRHILGENHVVAVEPKFIFPGLGVVGIENTWLVTEKGPRRMTITPDDHIIV